MKNKTIIYIQESFTNSHINLLYTSFKKCSDFRSNPLNSEFTNIALVSEHKLASQLFELGFDHVFTGLEPLLAFLKPKTVDLKSFKEDWPTNDELLLSKLSKVIATDNNQSLLIHGETGVGKTRLAKALHNSWSPKGNFVGRNLQELSPSLFEAEIFGVVKGAYTGSHETKPGILELANNGTLFLDEITALPKNLQQKLLKVLDEGVYTPVGGTKEKTCKFRLVSASCEGVNEISKNLRSDFFYRIANQVLKIPALRERKEDLEEILESFQGGHQRKLFYTPEALSVIKQQSWPGNLRELNSLHNQLLAERTSIIKTIEIEQALNSEDSEGNSAKEIKISKKLDTLIRDLEIQSFNQAMKKHGRKPNAICRELGISKSVYYRIENEYNLNYDQEDVLSLVS